MTEMSRLPQVAAERCCKATSYSMQAIIYYAKLTHGEFVNEDVEICSAMSLTSLFRFDSL